MAKEKIIKGKKRINFFKIVAYMMTFFALFILYFPIYWMLVTLTKDPVEANSSVPSYTFTVPNDYVIALDTTNAEGYVGKTEEEQEKQFQFEALDLMWLTFDKSMQISANSVSVVRVEDGVVIGKARLNAITFSEWRNKTELDENGYAQDLLFADNVTETLITNWYNAYINKDGKYKEGDTWVNSRYEGYAEKYQRLLDLLEEDGYSYGMSKKYKTGKQEGDKCNQLFTYLENALGYTEESDFLSDRQRIKNVTGTVTEVSYQKNYGGMFNSFKRAVNVYAGLTDSVLGLFKYFWNSVKKSFIQVAATCFFTAACSYAMACLVSKRMSGILFYLLMLEMMIPDVTNIVTLYNFWGSLNLKNTLWPFFFTSMGSAWWIIIFRGVFGEMARELREAAKIDGASELRIFLQIMLPLAQSMLVVLGLTTFVSSWNSYFWEERLLTNSSNWNITMVIKQSMNRVDSAGLKDVGLNMAVALIGAIPTLFIYTFFQKYMVNGLTFDGLKG